MTIACVTTAYGPAAHDALAQAVARAKDRDPLAPVTVVVPNHYVGLAARRALGRRSHNGTRGVAAVAFHTAYDLAERLGGAEMAAEGRRGVTMTVIAAAVRTVLRRDPGHFRGVETHPATERALTRAHRELSELEGGQLRALAAQSPRAADVVRIHQQVAADLETRFSNEQQLSRAAAAAVRADPAAVARQLGPMIVFLPQRITHSQAGLLRAVGKATDTTIVAGATGAEDADAVVVASVRRLGAELDAPARRSGQGRAGATVEALSVSDADDEVRHAVRAVVNAARAGTPLGRCAIVYGVESPYVRLISDALDAAGIRRCGAASRTVETSLLGRSLLEMLALPDRGFSRRVVMAWLASAPVSVRRPDTDAGAPDGEAGGGEPAARHRWQGVPSAAWEREARAARVESGIESWRRRLTRYAEDCTAEADHHSADEEQAWRGDRHRRSAERSRELLSFIEELHADLDPRPAPRTWAELAGWCQKLIQKYLGGRLRRSWPEEERQMAERVDRAVSRLGDLDGTDDEPSVAAFGRALRLELEGAAHRHGHLGAGVLVGPVDLALGVELDLAVVCGMAEGTFPARRNDDALLPDRERLVAGGDLPARADRPGDDHRALLAIVAAAGRSLLLHPRGDLRRAADRSPSRWLTEEAGEAQEVPSFVAGLRRTGFPAHAQEYDTRCVLDWYEARARTESPWSELARIPGVQRRPELIRGIELRRARMSPRLTRFDGNLPAGDLRGAVLAHPAGGETTSASRLEMWAGCPHAYFMRYVLRVEAIDDADDDHRISPLERGSLVHRILERWLAEAIADGAVPAPKVRWPESWRTHLLAVGEEECDRLAARGLVGRRLYWEHDRRQILADLVRFLDFDDEQRARYGSQPTAVELGFGMPHSASGPVSVEIGNGRSMNVRGSIDRVDATPHGGLLVVDYKTGSDRAYEKLGPEDPTLGGHRLQLVLYDLAARRLLDIADTADGHGAYWFVSTKGQFSDIGYATNAARRRVLKAVNAIVDGVGDGLFPLHPDEPVWRPWVPCGYCDPDGMGTRDQWRDFQRKRDDPALARYLDLVDPDREPSEAARSAAGAAR
ncbi:MAG: PD-(D/E)XK nuclease family protein [Acidimicrobiaceae bacterium]|nr:PD-(D/E)XK nuclease family protein [Acidimicrobiaceae bacterium]